MLLPHQFSQHLRMSPIHHQPPHPTSHPTRIGRAHTVSGSTFQQPMLTAAQSSFIRSSAPRSMMQASAPAHYPYAVSSFQSDSSSARSESVSSGGTDVSQSSASDRQEYGLPVVPSHQYLGEGFTPRMSWPSVEKMQYSDYPFQTGTYAISLCVSAPLTGVCRAFHAAATLRLRS